MSNYDNNLQVIVSKVVSDKQNAPTLRVSVEINGTKYQAGLWPWRRRDGSTVTDKAGNMQYKGKLECTQPSDARDQDGMPPHGSYSPQDDFDDDIPF